MSSRFKKIFLAVCIAIPFLFYCIYYYSGMIRNAPFKFSEFESITLKAGLGNKYEKFYNSKTQELQYIDLKDSVINKKVKISKDELLFLHRKAVELGFWNWPQKMLGDSTASIPKYYLEFKYQRKSKIIEINSNYNDNEKLRDAALQLIKTVDNTITDAEDRQKRK